MLKKFCLLSLCFLIMIQAASSLQRRNSMILLPDVDYTSGGDSKTAKDGLAIDEDSKILSATLRHVQNYVGSYVDEKNYGDATIVDISYPSTKQTANKLYDSITPNYEKDNSVIIRNKIKDLTFKESYTKKDIGQIIKFADCIEKNVNSRFFHLGI